MKLINNRVADVMRTVIAIFTFFCISDANSLTCGAGCGGTLETVINKSVSQNHTGYNTASPSITIPELSINVDRWGAVQQWTSYFGDDIPPSQFKHNEPVFKKIDDYLSIALSWTRCGRKWYVPVNIPIYGDGCRTSRIPEYRPGDVIRTITKEYQTILRIDRPMISGSFSRRIPIAETGVCQGRECRVRELVTKTIYVSIDLIVPQKCTLNAGQMISMSFGNINTGKFKKAGAMPEGVLPQSKQIHIKCSNMGGLATLTLRIEANSVAGNAIISNNKDVGFIVTDNNQKEFTPNSLSSTMPFTLGENAETDIIIKAYPVSITGNRPVEGPVTSLAYLRVDFD